VTFGVEYRQLNEKNILELVGPDARQKFDGVLPAGMGDVIDEDGVAVHVFLTATGDERLRFDCFDHGAHYHLLDPDRSRNTVIEHDDELGPVLDWSLEQLRTALPTLLAAAGADDAAALIDQDLVAGVVVTVERAAREQIAIGRPTPAPRVDA
jgi:hypothetical protein